MYNPSFSMKAVLRSSSATAARLAFSTITMLLVVAIPAMATGKAEIQKYFSKTAAQVKAADTPSAKRAILNESFQTMFKAMDIVRRSSTFSESDAAALNVLEGSMTEKRDELAGAGGFARVRDAQLNAFSDFVVQDMEQADPVVTVSLVTLLLIAILFVLLIK